MAVTLY